MKLRAPGRKPILLEPTRPSAAIYAWYRKELVQLVTSMADDIEDKLCAAYPKGMAQDDFTEAVATAFSDLNERWQGSFKRASKTLASTVSKKIFKQHDLAFKTVLDKSGFSVRFQMTPEMQAALDEKIAANVDLISSIPVQYLDEVEAMTRKSVEAGRNMKAFTEQLHERFGITKRRAELIARDQNNKASALFHKVRQLELGLDQAIWTHTAASKEPRPEHEEWGANKEVYNVADGMWSDVDGEAVWPGTQINCGCCDQTIIPGYDEDEEVEPELAATVTKENV